MFIVQLHLGLLNQSLFTQLTSNVHAGQEIFKYSVLAVTWIRTAKRFPGKIQMNFDRF